jgi:DNA gyrase/topoisomerase IV subunit B
MTYTAEDIKALVGLDAIRMRPGMYVGSMDIRGFKELLKYLFLELCSYLPAQNHATFSLIFKSPEQAQLRFESDFLDFARFETSLFHLLEDAVASYFIYPNHFGLSVLLALCEEVHIHSGRLVVAPQAEFYRIDTFNQLISKDICLEFKFSDRFGVFSPTELENIETYLQSLAYLHPFQKIIYAHIPPLEAQRKVFFYPNGIAALLDYKIANNRDQTVLFRIDTRFELADCEIRVCLAYADCWTSQSFIRSFANEREMLWGDSSIDGMFDALRLTAQILAKKENLNPFNINKKNISKNLMLIVHTKGESLAFGSTGASFRMPKIRKFVKIQAHIFLLNYFSKYPDLGVKWIDHLNH